MTSQFSHVFVVGFHPFDGRVGSLGGDVLENMSVSSKVSDVW